MHALSGVNCIDVSFAGNPLEHVQNPTADYISGSYWGKVAKSAQNSIKSFTWQINVTRDVTQ